MNLDILSTLYTEHRCLLDQAEHIGEQLDWVRRGHDPDYVLLKDRVYFLREHYIEVHRPKDKALFQKLVGDSGNLGAIMTPFLNAHAVAFLKNLNEPEADLQAVLCEQVVSRADLLRRGDRALHYLRQQIATEEAGPFPWARQRLEAGDWWAVGRGKEERPRVDRGPIAFPGLAKKMSSETVSIEDARGPRRILCFRHKDQNGVIDYA